MTSSDDVFPPTTGHRPNPNFHHQLVANANLPNSLHAPPPETNGENGYNGGAFNSQPVVIAPYENDSDPNISRINRNLSNPIHAPPHETNGGAFYSQANVIAPYETNSDPTRSRTNGKWSDRDELSDGGTTGTTPSSYKKSKTAGSFSGGEYRKDREEWSDGAIACLLDVYLDKFLQLSRGNLRGRDWEEVAAFVTDRCEKQRKSVEQCKNKVDNLKKRYKLERHRMMNMNNGGNVVISHWPWFKKMEEIVGNSMPPLKAVLGEENSENEMSVLVGQSKRYTTAPSHPSCQIITTKPKPVTNARWRRVVFKISGASLAGTGSHSVDPKLTMLIAREVSIACNVGVEVAIVVGGRNFFCGDTWVTATGMDRSIAYQIGMMATVMNSILIQSALEKLGVETRVQSAFSMPEVFEPYSKQRAIRHLEKGRVVIFGGIGAGTGNPLFSTDTAAALRASEIHADAFIKGTDADGVYECDSVSSVAFEHISFRDLASRGAAPMDMMAATFCEENGIPVMIFNLHKPGNISRALSGEHIGTLIDQTGNPNC